MLTTTEIVDFRNNGYLVIPGFADTGFCEHVTAFAAHELQHNVMPLEYERDQDVLVDPVTLFADERHVVSQLSSITLRYPLLEEWATSARLKSMLVPLLGQDIFLVQAHHNCITIKHPASPHMMGWHQDIRYWHFERPELLSTWLALGEEGPENGGLWVLPGSHKWVLEAYQFDERQCLRMDSLKNRELLERAHPIVLHRGDLLLLHSNVLYAAGRNTTDVVKFSMVFTYRASDNPPIRGTSSSNGMEIVL